jgi:hypothetical protein
MSLAWVFVFNGGQDCNKDKDCQQFIAGLVFFFFQSIISLAAASTFLYNEDREFADSQVKLPSANQPGPLAVQAPRPAPGASFPQSTVVTSSV